MDPPEDVENLDWSWWPYPNTFKPEKLPHRFHPDQHPNQFQPVQAMNLFDARQPHNHFDLQPAQNPFSFQPAQNPFDHGQEPNPFVPDRLLSPFDAFQAPNPIFCAAQPSYAFDAYQQPSQFVNALQPPNEFERHPIYSHRFDPQQFDPVYLKNLLEANQPVNSFELHQPPNQFDPSQPPQTFYPNQPQDEVESNLNPPLTQLGMLPMLIPINGVDSSQAELRESSTASAIVPQKRKGESIDPLEGPPATRQKTAETFDEGEPLVEPYPAPANVKIEPAAAPKLESPDPRQEVPVESVESIFAGVHPAPLTCALARSVRKYPVELSSIRQFEANENLEKQAMQALNMTHNDILGTIKRGTALSSGMPPRHKTQEERLAALHKRFSDRLGGARDDVGIMVSKLALKALQFQVEVRGYSNAELDQVWTNHTQGAYKQEDEAVALDHMTLMRGNPASWFFWRLMKMMIDDMGRISEEAGERLEEQFEEMGMSERLISLKEREQGIRAMKKLHKNAGKPGRNLIGYDEYWPDSDDGA